MRRFFQDRVTNLMKIFLDTDSRPDSYSDTDSTKQTFDLSNQTLNDY